MIKIFNNVKKWNWYKVLMYLFLVLFLVTFLLLVISNYNSKVNYAIYLKKMVWNKEGFNWTSVTALAALLGLFITNIANNKGIKANIISKERAKWLDNHKSNMANYLRLSREIELICNGNLDFKKENIKNSRNNLKEVQREYDLNVIEVNKKQQEMIYMKNILSLGLSEDNDDNNEFLKTIKGLIAATDSYRSNCFSLEEDTKKLKDMNLAENLKKEKFVIDYKNSVTELINQSKIYYKNVWKEIKKGK
ncbi:hypothetical protein B835_669 [Enterococcus mundtii 3F]|uniref:hypothetical protein n=1 Tax=Enterococcus mundtii TaxID=53346 RepID=UPI0023028AAC|nr:hypothetical protein [Enterococcus mundtii]MDA9460787.1 hypothetical protein [Enterococcus mundtii 3F]